MYHYLSGVSLLQGDPNQNLLFQLALSLKIGIPDPMLLDVGKAKMCLRGGGFLEELADFHM